MADYPSGTLESFITQCNKSISSFQSNTLLERLREGRLELADYHRILRMIFHQTFEGPSTFALAGAHCDSRYHEIRDYLIEHAEEERSHWQWVIEDLSSTGDTGPDPRTCLPHPACQKFISFNVYLAVRHPIARLGAAAVLEGIGAANGKAGAERLCSEFGLQPSQVKFFYGHGDTDVGHTEDIFRILSDAHLSDYDWAWLTYAAKTAGELYREMYECVANESSEMPVAC